MECSERGGQVVNGVIMQIAYSQKSKRGREVIQRKSTYNFCWQICKWGREMIQSKGITLCTKVKKSEWRRKTIKSVVEMIWVDWQLLKWIGEVVELLFKKWAKRDRSDWGRQVVNWIIEIITKNESGDRKRERTNEFFIDRIAFFLLFIFLWEFN